MKTNAEFEKAFKDNLKYDLKKMDETFKIVEKLKKCANLSTLQTDLDYKMGWVKIGSWNCYTPVKE